MASLVLTNLLKLLSRKGFRVFERPGELNLVGIRAKSRTPETFDDEIYAFWREPSGQWQLRMFRATTDPGTYWLQRPKHPRGTAILKEGQYVNCWRLGKHKGKYLALVQVGKMTVLLDNNQDGVLDLNADTQQAGSGINLHRAALDGKSVNIDQWSAGCQVIADSKGYAELMILAAKHQKAYGDLSYSLIDFRDYQGQQLRSVLWVAGLVGIAAYLIDETGVKKFWHSLTHWLTTD